MGVGKGQRKSKSVYGEDETKNGNATQKGYKHMAITGG